MKRIKIHEGQGILIEYDSREVLLIADDSKLKFIDAVQEDKKDKYSKP